jgi:hypothetical protein
MSIGNTEKLTKGTFLEHLINFVLQINPKDTEFIRYKSFLIDLKEKYLKSNTLKIMRSISNSKSYQYQYQKSL